MNKEQLRQLLQELLAETACPIKSVKLPAVSESDRLDTGDPSHRVYTHDLFTLSESPRLGCGVMEMEQTTFPWNLQYDEIDYVISGRLTVLWKDHTVTAGPGEVILIPKGSSIRFSVEDHTRFLYVTYPADWQNQAGQS